MAYELRWGHRLRTQEALQRCFEAHQPEIWIFGHYHRRVDFILKQSTRFVCVADLTEPNDCFFQIDNLKV